MIDDFEINKIKRMNQVLLALSDVGRLVVQENDIEKLIRGACKILVDRRGYFNAWIGLINKTGAFRFSAEAGLGENFLPMLDSLNNGKFTHCVNRALDIDDVVIISDPYEECFDCPLSGNYSGRGAVSVRLSHDGKVFGFLVLSLPRHLVEDLDEKALIKRIANGISLGIDRLYIDNSRQEAEEALKESEQGFRTLIENSLNCICIIQEDKIVYQKCGLRKIHGLLIDVYNPPHFKLIHPDDRQEVVKKYQDLVSGRIHHIDMDFRYMPVDKKRRNLDVRWALLRASVLDYKGTESVLTNVMDITDTKDVENYLRIQDKMTSLGRVTAGIAHEIRNPLSGIYIYLKTLKKIYKNQGDIQKVLSIIEKIEMASGKVESIIKRVMDFSRPGTPQFVMADLNPYIDEVTKLTAVTLRKNGIRLVKKLDSSLPECWTDPHLIEQVILNLITNAAEAMKDYQGDKVIELTTSKVKDILVITVTDSGPGIPSSSQTKIFDPFYTTKKTSSGIGLSICHRIITDHGGALKLKTGKNKGAEFIIELPLKGKTK